MLEIFVFVFGAQMLVSVFVFVFGAQMLVSVPFMATLWWLCG